MGRFELDDGKLRRFWEVELDGEALVFRSGDLGAAGRTVRRRYPSERAAQDTYDHAVRSMVAQGYAQVLELAEPRPTDGGGLDDDPDDPAALAVHADWLQSKGELRGELIALALSGDPALVARADALRDAHVAELAGPVASWPGELTLGWRWAYVATARFDAGNARGADPAGLAARLLAGPGFRFLRELTLTVPAAVQVALAGRLPALRALSVHAGVVGATPGPATALDLDRLATRYPRLRALGVRGGCAIAGRAALAGLTSLDARCTPEWADRLVEGGAPALVELALHGVDVPTLDALGRAGVLGRLTSFTASPAWDAPVDRLLAIVRRFGAPGLRLHLSGLEIDARVARSLAALPLGGLTLDGTLSAGADGVLRRAPFPVDGRQRVRRRFDPSSAPERPDELPLVRLIAESGDTWSIGVDGPILHVHRARAGAPGTWSWRRLPTEEVAEEVVERWVEEKLREGFAHVGDAPGGPCGMMRP